MCAALAFLAFFRPAAAADLAKIDRTIAKEPKYASQPCYALLVFGPDAARKVWLVLDGEVLYVDRNGNGDLTEPGERLELAKDHDIQVAPGMYSRMDVFDIGNLAGLRGQKGDIRFRLDHWIRTKDYVPKNDFERTIARERAANNWEQATLWRIIDDRTMAQNPITFAARPQDAQVSHFDGPLTFHLKLRDQQELVRSDQPAMLHLLIGTTGLPTRNQRYPVYSPLVITEVPADAHPVAEIEFPGKTPADPTIKVTAKLDLRC
jgi:hypothetical protein